MNIKEFQSKYARVAGVSFVEGNGGLPAIKVSRAGMEGEVYLHGGQVTRWKPDSGNEVLFVSELATWKSGKAIRGGVPICFPWRGPKKDSSTSPQHGFARTRQWSLINVTESPKGIAIEVSDRSDDQTQALWPNPFQITSRVTFGATLKMELEVINKGTEPFHFEEAQHTYFHVGDVQRISIQGLENQTFLDKPDGGATRTQQGEITFDGETDRPYVDTSCAIAIADPSLNRRITISKSNSNSTVIWNPWIERARVLSDLGDEEWRNMVCVETCNIEKNSVLLNPGQSHVMTTEISVSAL